MLWHNVGKCYPKEIYNISECKICYLLGSYFYFIANIPVDLLTLYKNFQIIYLSAVSH